MTKNYKIWTDSDSKIEIPPHVEQYYDTIDEALNVACNLIHEHDGKQYRAIVHVEDLEIEETVETCENHPNGCDV